MDTITDLFALFSVKNTKSSQLNIGFLPERLISPTQLKDIAIF